ncbi:metal-dependent transcriptional regulator [Kocuria sp.]|uniref:metal-dependent transcriptional regulator n=1 Tax=Kocuria sp. TaxID=1871328 RepID=UPI0026DBAE4D|nr:metal-dependent transcriptional regulator [Kocuria sp.]MDO4919178.1 metal-dependent transcriptional regulator [Kocuria sp.]
MHPAELTSSTQDYLKTIWRLGEWEPERVTTTSLAARMGLAPSTVSEALKKLTAQGLVSRPAYGVVELTAQGRDAAVHMVRRHRLLEMFLATELGYPWDEVHDEAEVLEHAVTDRFIDSLDAKLGHPGTDPHGDVIPSPNGTITPPDALPLTDVPAPSLVRVTRVSDADPETLRLLGRYGIGPGSLLRVLPNSRARGAVRVRPEADDAASPPGAEEPSRDSPGREPAVPGRRHREPAEDGVELNILVAEAVRVHRVARAT